MRTAGNDILPKLLSHPLSRAEGTAIPWNEGKLPRVVAGDRLRRVSIHV